MGLTRETVHTEHLSIRQSLEYNQQAWGMRTKPSETRQ